MKLAVPCVRSDVCVFSTPAQEIEHIMELAGYQCVYI